MESNTVTAVGVWFYCINTKRYLYLMRDDPRHPNSWGLVGGKCEEGESLLDAIYRECYEEIGLDFVNTKFLPLEKFTSPDGIFVYHTFFCTTNIEFVPILNEEHIGYAWIQSGTWPKPMHPGLWNTVTIDAIKEKMALLEKDLESTNYYINDTVVA